LYDKLYLMEENRNQLLNYTTYAGIYLGLFWVFKYLFVIAGNSYRIFNTIGSILSFGTPLLLFYFLVKYNTCLMQNKMSFWHGVQFSILLFFFASILESLVVFIHVKWIEPAYISNLYEKMIEMAQTINIGKSFASRLAEQPLPSIFSYIISNVILADVFLGFILSLIVVPTAMRLKKL